MNKLMRILYIGYQSISLNDSGGALGCIRNYRSILHLFGEGNLTTIILKNTSKPSFFHKIINNIHRVFRKDAFDYGPALKEDFSQYDIVFIDSSRLGNIAKKVALSGYKGKIVTFYHNFDYKFAEGQYKDCSFLKYWINVRVSLENERNAAKYSTNNVILNCRDEKELRDFYGMDNTFLIPVSLPDRFSAKEYENPLCNLKGKVFLFLGSYFFGNIIGLDWFMENVYPYVDINFVIVGKDMHKLKKNPLYKDVIIFSNVDDVTPFVVNADCMLYPIIGGSGMKIKTCEALMFGKNIIGSEEAFEGYDVDYEKVGACCSSKEDYISAINKFNKARFNHYSRELYIQKYSFDATLRLFKQILINNLN